MTGAFDYNLPFNKGKFLQFTDDGRAYTDYNFGIGAFTRGAAAPDFINFASTTIKTVGFDGVNTLEELNNVLEINHNWAEGTTIYPHVHWHPSTSAAGNVKWFVEYALVPPGVLTLTSTTISVIQATVGVAWEPLFASLPAIDASGLTIGTQMYIRLYRNPNDGEDTYGADAALATFGLHVLVDSLGSRELTSK